MRTVISILFVLIIIIALAVGNNYSTVNTQSFSKYVAVTDSTKQLPCCNSRNPFTQICLNPDGFVSYLCFENGVEVEKMISCACCNEIWKNNNYNPPIGLDCLPPGSECASNEDK
jgi:hypothetical protein